MNTMYFQTIDMIREKYNSYNKLHLFLYSPFIGIAIGSMSFGLGLLIMQKEIPNASFLSVMKFGYMYVGILMLNLVAFFAMCAPWSLFLNRKSENQYELKESEMPCESKYVCGVIMFTVLVYTPHLLAVVLGYAIKYISNDSELNSMCNLENYSNMFTYTCWLSGYIVLWVLVAISIFVLFATFTLIASRSDCAKSSEDECTCTTDANTEKIDLLTI